MTTFLENTTFRHDLDPSYASGIARDSNGNKVQVSLSSDGRFSNGATRGVNDANSFTVNYTGEGTLTSLVFNPQGIALTGGNVSGGNNGYTDGTRTSDHLLRKQLPRYGVRSSQQSVHGGLALDDSVGKRDGCVLEYATAACTELDVVDDDLDVR